MPLDEPSPAWHPAFMPNTAADLRPQPVSDHATLASGRGQEPAAITDFTPAPQDASRPSDFWSTGEDAEESWLGAADDAHRSPNEDAQIPDASESVDDTATAADAAPDAAPDSETTSSHRQSVVSKHQSVASFTRTVAHEVNWDAEDDDVEFSLTRTDTDPFKFMPPTDRTNSFPVVPQIPGSAHQLPPQQLPSTQAEALMAEIDREPSPTKFGAEASSVPTSAAAQSSAIGDEEPFAPRQYVGGDLPGPDGEASEARYEEGVPLISSNPQSGPKFGDTSASADLFSADSGAGDDFFSQLDGPIEDGSQEPLQMPSLERKSTMQVMGSLTANSLDRSGTGLEDPLEEAPEEEDFWGKQEHNEEDHPVSQRAEGPGTSGEAAPKASADLAAQWAAALGDDDDDDLLLDDGAPAAKEGIDPSAFFVDDGEGFLEDNEEDKPQSTPAVAAVAPTTTAPAAPQPGSFAAQTPATNGRYVPTDALAARQPVSRQSSGGQSQYLPSPAPFSAPLAPQSSATPSLPPQPAYGAPPPRMEPNRAASFADKSKGGYQSPYDLPVEIKPRKRPSTQHLAKAVQTPTPPPPPTIPSHLSRTATSSAPSQTQTPPAARSSSVPPHPPAAPHPNVAPTPMQSQPAAAASAKPPLRSQSGEGFFAELPMSSRVRPGSRSSQKSFNSPSQTSPLAPPHGQGGFPQAPPQGLPPQGPPTATHQQQPYGAVNVTPAPGAPSATAGLVAPERVNPYAPVHSNSMPLPTAVSSVPTSRYSPAPPNSAGSAASAPPVSNRYSPAPGAVRPPGSGGYAPSPHPAVPPMLPHQPRTSSPLAHFEVSHDKTRPSSSGHADPLHSERPDRRSSSAMFEPRLNRMPSLPPTREVEEEATFQNAPPLVPPSSSHSSHGGRPSSQGHVPGQTAQHRNRQTPPPPPLTLAQSTLSPPKRTLNYAPQSQQTLSAPAGPDFAPPARSHTQSPSALHGGRSGMRSADPIPRPSSVNDPTSPRSATEAPRSISGPLYSPAAVPNSRPRGFSQNLNLVPPTDGREHDPLQRWRGAPLIAWGVGGTLVTSFPRDVPRYGGIGQAMPSIVRSPGEVKIKNIKDIFPLEERLAKFPGPLKGKSKKKETIAWLTTGIETLERGLPNLEFHAQQSHEDKRTVERVLLWKILRLFIEFDGALEGSPAVEKAVRAVISPDAEQQLTAPASAPASYGMGPDGSPGLQGSLTTQMKSDGVDSATVEQIRRNLLVGDREKAVWDAADKRLWGHALLIANTVSPDLYKKVSQEFVRKEVNYPGHNNEPLAVLYEVLSGNHEECVDELVPSHARAGLQLMATNAGHGQSGADILAGLDKWRETLGLVLSNRSSDDVKALNSLGMLLAGYGRAEAAHICYLFARSATVFGGLDDASSHFVLVGADHKRQADQFAKETEALLLSEVYEYGLSLANASSRDTSCPHLAAYKLQHAMILAEHGYRDNALHYCEALAAAITAQTRRSPYYHAALEAAVDDLTRRLRQAPKEESNSWIPKPSMHKVSDTMWNRFNKFVAGDEGEGVADGSADGAGGSGPFGHLPGGTPTISRPPSAGASTGMEMFGGAGAGPFGAHGYPVPSAPVMGPPPTTKAGSRYAPAASGATQAVPSPYDPSQQYSPMAPPSTGRSSGEYSRGSLEFTRRSSEIQRSAYVPALAPNTLPSPAASPALATTHDNSYVPSLSSNLAPAPAADNQSAAHHPGYQPYTPPDYSMNGSPYAAAPHSAGEKPPPSAGAESNSSASAGYQPPSYGGYEPPTMTPYESMSTEKSEPAEEGTSTGGYEPPSFQPSSYDPPSYQPDPEGLSHDAADAQSMPGSSHRDDGPAAPPVAKPDDKSKEEKDRENQELFRKAAEEDAKRAEAEKAAKAKKGWLGGWFGGGGAAKKEAAAEQPKAIRAKLGEQSSFYFDPELKRWVNKKAGADAGPAGAAGTPPPPRSAPRSASATPPPPSARASAPPRGLMMSASIPNLAAAAHLSASQPSLMLPPMQRSVSNGSDAASAAGGTGSAPPSRPTTSMSNASSADDFLAAAGQRGRTKKPRKSGRYVDVMAK